MRKFFKRVKPLQIVLFVVLLAVCLIWLFPLYYILMTALSPEGSFKYYVFDEIFGKFLIPHEATLETFKLVLQNTAGAPILKWLENSVITAVSHAFLTVLISSMAAYGYARMDFKGKNALFAFLMFTMMIPGVINLIPQYYIVSSLKLKNNLLALILPGLAGVGNIFLIRQFFYSVPKELDEAAKIDGAGELCIFFRILIPQIVPVLVVVALNSFLGSWNDLLWPIIIMDDTRARTLTAGLSAISGEYDTEYASRMAATVISAIPVLLVYVFSQKYLLQGISLSSGIKG